jgi:lactoylglutathione lyase
MITVTISSASYPPMNDLPQLNLVVLRSPDIDRAADFYRRLGLTFVRHSHGSGAEHYCSEVAGLVFELYPATSVSPSTSGTRIGFRVDSVDRLVPLLVEAGAKVRTAPADSEWGRRAVMTDPDGHAVELISQRHEPVTGGQGAV